MEISISEIAGDLTIREDDTAWLEGVTQSRVVSNVTEDLQVELNTAMFSAFYDQHNEYGGGRPFGVIVGDYVDVDELYPYSPAQRVRQDVTALLTVSSETRTKVNAHGKKEEELVVILTRSCLIRLNHAELSLGPCVVQRMRDSICKWGDVMLTKMREIYELEQFEVDVGAELWNRTEN
uniref:Uncharacterized protein n=1 Tax=Globisporangium ultimum (strain ATCC 200006 / CBS 805.95 / DAOM BR144) TaxID=431595 RepID=K3X394_GLOUD